MYNTLIMEGSSYVLRHHIICGETAMRLLHPFGGVGRKEEYHHVGAMQWVLHFRHVLTCLYYHYSYG